MSGAPEVNVTYNAHTDEMWPRRYESTLVPFVRAEVEKDPVHFGAIGHLLEQAARELEHERFGRCICRDVWCCVNQIQLRAWHLAWSRWRVVGVLAARITSL